MVLLAQHLEYWKEQARRNPHEAIYILHWYDVKAFAPQSMSTNAIEIIISTLISALNNRPKLPNKIIIMLGDTKFWCEANALRFTMDVLLKVFLQELKRIISTRQQDLPPKAVGEDPELFVVKLNWKPEYALDSVSSYPKKRRTFNKLLDTVFRPRGVKTIMLHEVNATLDPDLFLTHGELSEKGYRQVWKSLSVAIQDFNAKGHQKKKVFSVKEKLPFGFEMKDTFRDLSSDEDSIANSGRLAFSNDDNPTIQNKRRNKKGKNGPLFNRNWTGYNQ